jgi:serine/threonine protein kinase
MSASAFDLISDNPQSINYERIGASPIAKREDPETILIGNNRYFLEKSLGQGSFKNVSVWNRDDGKKNVFCIMPKYPNVVKEIEIIKYLMPFSNPNIAVTEKIFIFNGNVTLIQPFLTEKTLYEYVESYQDKRSIKETCFIQLQIVDGLSFLHQKKICHRDIKVENILCWIKGGQWKIQITDFGGAIDLRDEKETFALTSMTPSCISFQLLLYYQKTAEREELKNLFLQNDIWAMGLLFYLLEKREVFPYQEFAISLLDESCPLEIKKEIQDEIENYFKKGWDKESLEKISDVTKSILDQKNFYTTSLNGLACEIRKELLMDLGTPFSRTLHSSFRPFQSIEESQ